MPRRPPKTWFRSCVAGVTRSGGAAEPRAVCGAVWKRKGPKERSAITGARERSPKPHANRSSGFVIEVFDGLTWGHPITMFVKKHAIELARTEAKRRHKSTRVMGPGGDLVAQVYPPHRNGPAFVVIP